MVIDVRGVNTHNKGAQLMMIAIAERLVGHSVATSPNGSSYDVRARLGYQQTLIFNQGSRMSSIAGNCVPRKLRTNFGLASASDISAVIDAAGYAYGDSFSAARAKREQELSAIWRKRGLPRVFLPQAFGPFNKPEIASWSRKLLEDATIIFARDSISADYVRRLCPSAEVRQCVDFTLGLEGVDPVVMQDEYGVIVPNSKMYTHSNMSRSEYVDLNVQCAKALHAAGLLPVVMAHESTDLELAREIAALSGASSFWDPSPLVLKGLVKGATLTVGSRYHALVGSLSSSKPTVALGWSHKYEELFSDFGVNDWAAKDARSVPGMIEGVLGDVEGTIRLKAALSLRMKEVDSMWSDVARAVAADDREGS